MNKICIIGIYYGEFPAYFPLWLKSCEYNTKIDFLVVTDTADEGQLPSNVRFLNMTLESLRQLASKKIGFDICLNTPKKLCDYKPMFGLIFEDYISQYEYWGECDFDLIWGDIYYFLSKYEYQKYDKFLPLGHLCLYKNTKEVNNYFRLPGAIIGDYKSICSTNENMIFDEIGGINSIVEANGIPFFNYYIFADICRLYKRYQLSGGLTPDNYIQKNYNHQIFYWKEGKVCRDYLENGIIRSDEFMYIHFSGRKNFAINKEVVNSDSFYISNEGFSVKNDITIIDDFREINKYPGKLWEKMEDLHFLMYRIFRKLGFNVSWSQK